MIADAVAAASAVNGVGQVVPPSPETPYLVAEDGQDRPGRTSRSPTDGEAVVENLITAVEGIDADGVHADRVRQPVGEHAGLQTRSRTRLSSRGR